MNLHCTQMIVSYTARRNEDRRRQPSAQQPSDVQSGLIQRNEERMTRHITWKFLLVLAGLIIAAPSSAQRIEWSAQTGAFDDAANWDGGVIPEFQNEALINNGGTAQFDSDGEVMRLTVGLNGGSGTFEQSSGVFLANGAFIGDNSNGVASISGGEFLIGGDSIHVGWEPGAVGVMNISGAETIVTSGDDFQLGRSGTGTLNLSGGTLSAGYTVVGKFGTGTWNQTGGHFAQAFGDVEVGDGGRDDQASTPGPRLGTFNLSGGILQVSGDFAIGNRRGGGIATISGGIVAITGGDSSDLYIGRGADSSPGVGQPVELVVRGGDATIAMTGSLLMNLEDVAPTSTLTAQLTGLEFSTLFVAGDADVTNGTLKVELDGYAPKLNDSWALVQAGMELDAILDAMDSAIDAQGYVPNAHGFPAFQGEVRGPFANLDLAPLPAGLDWDVSYSDNTILLSVIEGAGGVSGDLDGNGVLDAADINLLSAGIRGGSSDPAYDLNGDGSVNSDDRTFWVSDLKNTYMGDSNLDGEFNSSDFVFVFQAGQYEDGVAGNSAWETGDWNGDTEFDSSDFVTAFQAGGFEQGPRAAVSAVPEPTSLTLLGMTSLMIAGRLRIRRK
jgi:T5SS/PEP-CTERM-associated repeat protein